MLQPLNVGIAGLGTVGSSVVQILERRANALARATGRNIRVTGVSARSKHKHRELASKYKWFSDPVELAGSPDIDVFVEAVGGRDGPALDAINRALDCGKHVVTANKALLAHNGMQLALKAEQKNLILNFEAVVAGGIPIIKNIREALVGNSIEKIYGILNGTCNYILTKMVEDRMPFQDALELAQKLGYAELDPSADVDGIDTAHKLAVLATLAFGVKLNPDLVSREGIRGIDLYDLDEARTLGYEIKLLGIAERNNDGILLRVHPALVPQHLPLAKANGVLNAVTVKADAVNLTSIGPGAGGDATASAVVADIADIARGSGLKNPLLRQVEDLENFSGPQLSEHHGAFYIRLVVEDRVGVLATITNEMAKQNISLASIKQIDPRSGRDSSGKATAPIQSIVMITHRTSEKNIGAVLGAIAVKEFICGKPKVMRIED